MRRKDLPPQHKVTKKEGVKCNYCSKIGHLEKDCRKKSADAKEKIRFHCKCLDMPREDWIELSSDRLTLKEGPTQNWHN